MLKSMKRTMLSSEIRSSDSTSAETPDWPSAWIMARSLARPADPSCRRATISPFWSPWASSWLRASGGGRHDGLAVDEGGSDGVSMLGAARLRTCTACAGGRLDGISMHAHHGAARGMQRHTTTARKRSGSGSAVTRRTTGRGQPFDQPRGRAVVGTRVCGRRR